MLPARRLVVCPLEDGLTHVSDVPEVLQPQFRSENSKEGLDIVSIGFGWPPGTRFCLSIQTLSWGYPGAGRTGSLAASRNLLKRYPSLFFEFSDRNWGCSTSGASETDAAPRHNAGRQLEVGACAAGWMPPSCLESTVCP